MAAISPPCSFSSSGRISPSSPPSGLGSASSPTTRSSAPSRCDRCRSRPAISHRLARLLLRHLLALLAGFRQADGDRLFAALDGLAASAALQRSALLFMHRALDILRGGFGIFACHCELLQRRVTPDATTPERH